MFLVLVNTPGLLVATVCAHKNNLFDLCVSEYIVTGRGKSFSGCKQATEEAKAVGGYVKAAPGRAAHAVAEETRAVGRYVKAAPGRAAHAVAEEARTVGGYVKQGARVAASMILSKL